MPIDVIGRILKGGMMNHVAADVLRDFVIKVYMMRRLDITESEYTAVAFLGVFRRWRMGKETKQIFEDHVRCVFG